MEAVLVTYGSVGAGSVVGGRVVCVDEDWVAPGVVVVAAELLGSVLQAFSDAQYKCKCYNYSYEKTVVETPAWSARFIFSSAHG